MISNNFFFKKMILAKIKNKIYNSKFSAIIKIFKIEYHYLEDYKHKILIFINYNSFYYFINIKNLCFKKFARFKNFLNIMYKLNISKAK